MDIFVTQVSEITDDFAILQVLYVRQRFDNLLYEERDCITIPSLKYNQWREVPTYGC